MRKRAVLASFVAAVAVLALGAAALAAGGFGSPGTTTFTDLSVSAALTDSNGGFLFLSVDRGMQTFKLRGVNGPPVMVGPETVLSFSGNSSDGTYFNGCFVVPDSSFTVANNLGTASLNVNPADETPCPGFLLAADAGGRPGLAGPAPDAGGGGGGGSAPITANLVWASNGAVTSFDVTTNSRCQGSVAHSVGSSLNTFASVSGSVSPLADVTAQFAAINRSDTTEVATGTFSDACTGA